MNDLTTAAKDGALSLAIGAPVPLDNIAVAHDLVDAGVRHRVILALAASSAR